MLNALRNILYQSKKKTPNLALQTKGVTKAVTRNNSLLFLSTCNPNKIAEILLKDPILHRALKKAFVVREGSKSASLINNNDCIEIVQSFLEQERSHHIPRSFRLNVFPPSRLTQLLSTIEKIQNHSIVLDPKNYTHTVSIVQVYTYKGRAKEESTGTDALVMWGTAPALNTGESFQSNDDAVSRAYFKLKEAFTLCNVDTGQFHGCVALDCGSAPGGWTKYLASDLGCGLVYSVDPGKLLIDMSNVRHIQMKIQDAILLLRQENHPKIKIWVSDMCLHEMESQVDFLLLAKKEGILEESVFFVLTLKCNTGFSKDYFDNQARKVLQSLKARAKTRNTAIYHLFSNRSGERTILGFLE